MKKGTALLFGALVGLYISFNIWGVGLFGGSARPAVAVVLDTSDSVQTQTGSSTVDVISSEIQPCDFAVLRAQSLALLQPIEDGLSDVWELSHDEGSPYTHTQYADLGGTELDLCAYEIAYFTQEDDADVSGLENTLIEHLKKDGWETPAMLEIPIGEAYEPVLLSFAHAGGPLGQTTVFIKKIDGYNQVLFATVSNQRWQQNRKAYMEGTVEDPCPCSAMLELTLSAPMDLIQYAQAQEVQVQSFWEQAQPASASTNTEPLLEDVCDFTRMEQTAQSYVQEAFSDKEGEWEMVTNTSRNQSERRFGVVATGEYLHACEYEFGYNRISEGTTAYQTQSDSPEYALRQRLKEEGWLTTHKIDLKSAALEKQLSLVLTGDMELFEDTTIFVKFYPAERAVQFARLVSGEKVESKESYMSGESGSPCPCADHMSLSISGIVALTPYFERFGREMIQE